MAPATAGLVQDDRSRLVGERQLQRRPLIHAHSVKGEGIGEQWHYGSTIFYCWEEKIRNYWRWTCFSLPISIWGVGKYQILRTKYKELLEMLAWV